jgi:hypothetical protein
LPGCAKAAPDALPFSTLRIKHCALQLAELPARALFILALILAFIFAEMTRGFSAAKGRI